MSKKELITLGTLIFFILLVFKYANNIISVAEIVFPNIKPPQAQQVSGHIKSCKIINYDRTKINSIDSNTVLLAIIILKNSSRTFPLKLDDQKLFSQMKKVCDQKSYILIDYVVVKNKFSDHPLYHVNQVSVPETSLVFDSFIKINN